MFQALHKKLICLVQRRSPKVDVARGIVTSSVHVASCINHPSEYTWDFKIVFKSGKDLLRGDLMSSDPFLEAYLGPPESVETLSYVTGVNWETLDPTWDATWSIGDVKEGTTMEIRVMDKNKMAVDTDLGKAFIVLGSKFEGTRDHIVDVWQSETKKHGQLLIQITGTQSLIKEVDSKGPTTTGPAQYSRHTSYAAGILTSDKKFAFHTYRVRLYHLFEIFGTDPTSYQHWNTEYDAAKRIFAGTIEGYNIRGALHSQHAYLYRHNHRTTYGELANAEDFAMMIHQDQLRDDPNCDISAILYTYSIIPKGLYFSETGRLFFQDFMSKHAMHANRSTEVMYSGEFRLYRDKDNNNAWTLLIDNNSGTYAPDKSDLHLVKEVFERNFPDLVVIALDREDPFLANFCEKTKVQEAIEVEKHGGKMNLYGGIESKSEQSLIEAHKREGHICQV